MTSPKLTLPSHSATAVVCKKIGVLFFWVVFVFFLTHSPSLSFSLEDFCHLKSFQQQFGNEEEKAPPVVFLHAAVFGVRVQRRSKTYVFILDPAPGVGVFSFNHIQF